MHIEFLGVMGSGKTTLCNSVNHSLYQKLGYFPGPISSYLSISRDPVLYLKPSIVKYFIKRNYFRLGKLMFDPSDALVSFMNENKKLVSRIFALIDENDRKNSFESEELKYFLSLITFYQRHSKYNKRDIFLIDEGFANSLRHFLIDSDFRISEKNLSIFDLIPRIDYIIHCQLNPMDAYSRMLTRPSGVPRYLEKFKEDQRIQVLNSINKRNLALLNLLESKGISVIKIDSNKGVNENTQEVINKINF
jgi:hypothetical protein